MANRSLEEMLEDQFDPKHVHSALKHFRNTVTAYRVGNWEDSIAKMGKFVEAALKAVCKHASEAAPLPRTPG
jgi:hypothetical protein